MTDDRPDPAPDTPAVRPAGENPWYVLMTVAGEQDGDQTDWELHARNRRYWNGWMAQALSHEQKQKLIEEGRVKGKDLKDLSPEEHAAIEAAWAERCPDAARPDPAKPICDLSGCKVSGALVCRGFVFAGRANFRSATFPAGADFRSATFLHEADFRSANFSKGSFFTSVTFSGAANFSSAVFSSIAFFRFATFSYVAILSGANFSGPTFFSSAAFETFVYFESATFSDDAFFNSVTFSGPANFRSATFSNKADYSNADCKARTSFKGAVFRTGAFPPAFFNADLHEDTDFTDVAWPPVPEDRDTAIEHRRAYERLKLLMDDQKKLADEHLFFKLELQCREAEARGARWTERDFWVTRASRLFGRVCDYGRNPVTPAAALLGLVVLGWAAIYSLELNHPPEPLGIGQAAALSLSNVFGFLGFNRTFLSDEIRTLSMWSEIVAGVQTFFGLFFLFFLGLALRNQFRIK